MTLKPLSLLLVGFLVLSACGGVPRNEITRVATPTVKATEEVGYCGDDGAIFMPGDDVALGTEPGGDYTAVLSVGKSSFLRPYNLVVIPKDGAELFLAGGSLPKSGDSVTLTWGPYLEVEVKNCGLFYHYKVVKLLGASAKPVTDLTCIPADYSQESLKPWPFASHQTVWTEGKDEVLLVSDSDPKMYLAFIRSEVFKEAVAFRRPLKGETTVGSIKTGGGEVFVEVKNCDGSYFFKTGFKKSQPSPPSYRRIKAE